MSNEIKHGSIVTVTAPFGKQVSHPTWSMHDGALHDLIGSKRVVLWADPNDKIAAIATPEPGSKGDLLWAPMGNLKLEEGSCEDFLLDLPAEQRSSLADALALWSFSESEKEAEEQNSAFSDAVMALAKEKFPKANFRLFITHPWMDEDGDPCGIIAEASRLGVHGRAKLSSIQDTRSGGMDLLRMLRGRV